ncbi:MAG: BREX system P-loop protein BrxC [Kiritimatiellae bacterium]|nr:BREX system P-loop protein BrxC [Kiritimatiellia bacterium]
MRIIKNLFDNSKQIDRHIEKVISYASDSSDSLKQEVTEYVITESIEEHFSNLLTQLGEGLGGNGAPEIGVWVSGFYGSGKSSFTKYLGFALDPTRKVDGQPFSFWLKNQFKSKASQSQLATMAKQCPATVIMLDLAGSMLAGATMTEISSVLYAKVMQWAGYSRDSKVAYLEFLLEREGKLEAFKTRIVEISNGKSWDALKNQPLATKALASKVACEFYPDFFPDVKTFNEIRLEEQIMEEERVKDMLDLIERRSNTPNIIFILDEVGQYISGRDDLILNLDGLAKNLKRLGKGRVWLIATAQQTLTEDDPRAAMNSAKLFKLKDRFPIPVVLEANDIKEICYSRLLSKSQKGEEALRQVFSTHGQQLRHSTALTGTKFYNASLDEHSFVRFYPFLPHHFDILLQLLARLAKTRGGVGLRSAIKVIQDVLIDPVHAARNTGALAENTVGTLATAADFYDTLHADLNRSFPFVTDGVDRASQTFGVASLECKTAKAIAVLQILEDFPVSRENVAACLHPGVEAASLSAEVIKAVEAMLSDSAVPLSEVDGSLRFMSEAVVDIERERMQIMPRSQELRSTVSNILRTEVFSPVPQVKLLDSRPVATGFKVYSGAMPVSLVGDKDTIQTHVEFTSPGEHQKRIHERLIESQQPASKRIIFLIAQKDPQVDALVMDICRCRAIHKNYRNKAVDKEVEQYLRAQNQRAESLERELANCTRQGIISGSVIFNGQPRSVGELGATIEDALKKHLVGVAIQVFSKYGEAAVSADTGTAEGFLKTEKLNGVSSRNDPLGLVKTSGGTSKIGTEHKAMVSIKDYLEQHGQVDGRRMLDDFYNAPYGWSKDTTRYLIAAMLVAGVVKLRVGGEDITVRGDVAVNALRNTNAFNKVGVALRDGAPDIDVLTRATDRLLELTAEQVMPLEEDISKCVMLYFPDFQKAYAPLEVMLSSLSLSGCDRAQSVQDNIAELLKGDASDATVRLGGESCPLYEDLIWAKEVKEAFDKGIAEVIRTSRKLLSEIPQLPSVGILGNVISETQFVREELADYVASERFMQHRPEIQSRNQVLGGVVEKAVVDFAGEQTKFAQDEITRIQAMPEWNRLGLDDKNRFSAEFDGLIFKAGKDLEGLRQLLTHQYTVSQEIRRIETEIKKIALEQDNNVHNDNSDVVIRSVSLPAGHITLAQLDKLATVLEGLRALIESGSNVQVNWE